jgi:hypothetical protein
MLITYRSRLPTVATFPAVAGLAGAGLSVEHAVSDPVAGSGFASDSHGLPGEVLEISFLRLAQRTKLIRLCGLRWAL